MPAEDLLYLLSDELIDQVRGPQAPSLPSPLASAFSTSPSCTPTRALTDRSARARAAPALSPALRRDVQGPPEQARGGPISCRGTAAAVASRGARVASMPAHCPSASPLTLRQRPSRSAADYVSCDLRPGALTDTATALRWLVLIRTWSLRTVRATCVRVPPPAVRPKAHRAQLAGALQHTYGLRVLYVPRLRALAARRHARYVPVPRTCPTYRVPWYHRSELAGPSVHCCPQLASRRGASGWSTLLATLA
eukprot:scaffold17146_cov61-Phaeocystis_antarctica.AAC.4